MSTKEGDAVLARFWDQLAPETRRLIEYVRQGWPTERIVDLLLGEVVVEEVPLPRKEHP